MPIYQFKIGAAGGSVKTVSAEGSDVADAARRLQENGQTPLECLGEGTSERQSSSRWSGGNRKELLQFTERLAPLLQAGVPLDQTLAALHEEENSGLGILVTELRRGLHEGRRLADMMERHGDFFPPLYINVVRAGEEAGALAETIEGLRRHLREQEELRSFVISSSLYPAFVFGGCLLVMLILLGVIVPRFAETLAMSGAKLRFSTTCLLTLSSSVRHGWWVPPLLLAAVPAIWFRLTRNEGWRLSFDGWRLRLPWIGGLVLRSETARLARTLAVLLRSGVHLLDAVAISARVIENRALRASLAGLTQELRQGEGLSKALRRNRLMPTLLVRMLEVGEETGSLDRMLERAAEIHENELRTSVRRGLSLLEPVLICLLGLMVGAIVLAMFLAISDMQNRV